jgi:TolA protein
VGRVEYQKPQVEEQQTRPRPVARPSESPLALRPAKPVQHHEVHPSFAPANRAATPKSAENSQAAQAASQAELNRLRQAEESLTKLASGVQTSAAEKTTVDIPGLGGGGELFAGYNEVVKSIYYRAWITQDTLADRVVNPVARIVVARDGTIVSAELTNPSGDPALDRSVERALRAVPRLPPFPAGAREEERAFRIRFSLDAKKASG